MNAARGFTLLEVLVALAIFALVAASILTASARSLQTAARLEDKTLALWIADNQLIELQLEEPPPGEGSRQGRLDYAGRPWQWQARIGSTAHPALRRVELWVTRGGESQDREQALLALSGFLEVAP